VHLTLIRHGESIWNVMKKVQGQADPPLTEAGISQSQELAEKLGPILSKYAAVYTSERQRARKVAEIINSYHPVPLIADSRLNSRSLGVFSGLTLDEIHNQYPVLHEKWLNQDPTFVPPGGKSTKWLVNQTKSFLASLSEQYLSSDDTHILIITHRENIGAIHYLLTGELMDDPLGKIPNCTPLEYTL
jgi:probable phosphoglycerate mutase